MNAIDLLDKLIADNIACGEISKEDIKLFLGLAEVRRAFSMLVGAAELVTTDPASVAAVDCLAREVAACQRAPTCTHVDLPRWEMAA